MLFNSYEFIFLFLPLSFFIYFYLLQQRLIIGAKGFLVFASLFFYSWWNVAYLPIILSSMLFNYIIGNTLNDNLQHIKMHRKTLLAIGISANLALLGYFKYSDFFIKNFNVVFDTSIPLLHVMLPLAISFFTFQQIAYLVDSYRAETKEYDFLNYALFVTFFPQLIAGPIVHHSEMMPQFASKWNLVKKYKNIAAGLFIFCIGLFKKVVIADTFALWATNGFDIAQTLNMIEAWATSLSYTFQLYFDFSGYTDMAIGAALLFNIRLPINFNSPYKALSIQDFWRRWHITLSRFLKEYIYIPLGGNRKGALRTYSNLLATFILGGIWHGAGWTFVFWGFLHGLALVIHRAWQSIGFKLPKVFAWFITFNFINISWVFFRAKEWDDALKVLDGMFFGAFSLDIASQTLLWILLAFVVVLAFINSFELHQRFKLSYKNLLLTLILLYLALERLSSFSEFLYFNF
jgi:D-alanyl-lipoteichoic acid acyltransferase DltB (MBOAT superfamily)